MRKARINSGLFRLKESCVSIWSSKCRILGDEVKINHIITDEYVAVVVFESLRVYIDRVDLARLQRGESVVTEGVGDRGPNAGPASRGHYCARDRPSTGTRHPT